MAELVAVYLDDTAERIDGKHASLAKDDIGATRTAAHAVKGSSANLGFREMEILCKRLETASGEAAPWLLADAAAAFESLAAGLRKEAAAEVDS